MNLFLIVVIMGLLVIIFFLVKNNEKSTQKIHTKDNPNTSENTPSLPRKTIEVESPDYKDIKGFDSIQELKIYIYKEMGDRIGLVENIDIPFLYQRNDSNDINANITLKKKSAVYIYIDFNLMYQDPSWNKSNLINLNLCINDESLKSELLSKNFPIQEAYSIRNTYPKKLADLGKKYCADLKITSLKDLEKVLKISKDFLKE